MVQELNICGIKQSARSPSCNSGGSPFIAIRDPERESQPQTPYRKRIELEKKRHCGEYLLRDLAARTFLPGYGFPTDVVTFDNFTMEDYIREKLQKVVIKGP